MKNLLFTAFTKVAIWIMGMFLILPVHGMGQLIQISGQAKDRPGQLVRVTVYADQFSHLETTLATTQTDAAGKFELSFEYAHTDFAMLALNLDKGEFYLKPGASYIFDIEGGSRSDTLSYFDKMPLSFSLEATDDGLNESIEQFNVMYSTFVLEQFNSIYKSKNLDAVNEFEDHIYRVLNKQKDPYFEAYVKYKIASLQWVSRKRSSAQIIDQFYRGQAVLYRNIEYTGFFTELFENYPANYVNLMPYSEIVEAFNERTSYADFDKILARDTLLMNQPQLRELVAMLSMSKYYYITDFNRGNVVKVLRQVERNSAYAGNRSVAANYITRLSKLSFGNPAPGFELKNKDGDAYSLNDFLGKFVLLNFVRPDCKLCFQYMPLLDELREKQNGALQIVNIVWGDPGHQFQQYAESRNYGWPVLDLGSEILLLEDYDIRTFPSYVIIRPDGTVAMSPAPMPEENLDYFLERFMKNYQKEN